MDRNIREIEADCCWKCVFFQKHRMGCARGGRMTTVEPTFICELFATSLPKSPERGDEQQPTQLRFDNNNRR